MYFNIVFNSSGIYGVMVLFLEDYHRNSEKAKPGEWEKKQKQTIPTQENNLGEIADDSFCPFDFFLYRFQWLGPRVQQACEFPNNWLHFWHLCSG